MNATTPNTQPRIYLDNAAATAVDPRVIRAMEPYWSAHVGNPGGLHSEGRTSSDAVRTAREQTAAAIDARPEDIIFTSGGTESNNLAILGTVRKQLASGTPAHKLHVVTSVVEHSSVADCFGVLERMGVAVTYLPVDEDGFVQAHALEDALRPETILVSLIYVNNEIGTIERVKEHARTIHAHTSDHGPAFPLVHSDASQAPVWLHINVRSLGVDFLTLDSQKLYGPKGIGCLYARDKTLLEPLIYGGGHGGRVRPGTVPVPLVVGFATALTLVEDERDAYVTAIAGMRDRFLDRLSEELPDAMLNGPLGDERIAGNLNMSFFDIEGDQLVIELDVRGIAASTASACDTGRDGGSRVVAALLKYEDRAVGTVRFSLSRHTTEADMERAFDALKETVTWLQASQTPNN